MVLTYEIEQCILGTATRSQEASVVEHYSLGGFHSGVVAELRTQFIEWLERKSKQTNQPEQQLELFSNGSESGSRNQ